MGSTLATKQDIRLLEQKLEQKIELLQSSMTIRLGSILVVAMGPAIRCAEADLREPLPPASGRVPTALRMIRFRR
jgi:hypothetical protein